MSTGIESWKNLAEIGPLYPFVGTEVILVVVGLVVWIGWHIIQISNEKEHLDQGVQHFRQKRKRGSE